MKYYQIGDHAAKQLANAVRFVEHAKRDQPVDPRRRQYGTSATGDQLYQAITFQAHWRYVGDDPGWHRPPTVLAVPIDTRPLDLTEIAEFFRNGGPIDDPTAGDVTIPEGRDFNFTSVLDPVIVDCSFLNGWMDSGDLFFAQELDLTRKSRTDETNYLSQYKIWAKTGGIAKVRAVLVGDLGINGEVLAYPKPNGSFLYAAFPYASGMLGNEQYAGGHSHLTSGEFLVIDTIGLSQTIPADTTVSAWYDVSENRNGDLGPGYCRFVIDTASCE